MPIGPTVARPAPAALPTPGPAFRSKEPAPHHRVMNLAPADILAGWTVLICDSLDAETVMLRDWVASLGGTSIRIAQVGDAAPFIARHRDAKIALILEARADDLERRIDECLDLRARFPDCPIILMSESFGRNDFSTERMAVCDVSLRSPVSQVAFKLGVPAALSNNAYFVSRQASGAVARPAAPARVAPTPAGPVAERSRQDAEPAQPEAWPRLKSRVANVCLSCGVGLALSAGAVFLLTA